MVFVSAGRAGTVRTNKKLMKEAYALGRTLAA